MTCFFIDMQQPLTYEQSCSARMMRGFVHGSPANGDAGWFGYFLQDRNTQKFFFTEQRS